MGSLLPRPSPPKTGFCDAEENYKARVKPFRKNCLELKRVNISGTGMHASEKRANTGISLVF